MKTSFYSSPIKDDILVEMGIEPGYDLEKMIDKSGFIESYMVDDERKNVCSVHKAVVPIARMRVLLDQDDIGDTVWFRCPECSKCLTCKKSQRGYGKITTGSLRASDHRAECEDM